MKRTAGGGGEIVALLKTGSAYYAPAASTTEMLDAVLKDKHKVLPCCCLLEGEYGIKDVVLGVPCHLGASGVVSVEELTLRLDKEKAKHAPAMLFSLLKARFGRCSSRSSEFVNGAFW